MCAREALNVLTILASHSICVSLLWLEFVHISIVFDVISVLSCLRDFFSPLFVFRAVSFQFQFSLTHFAKILLWKCGDCCSRKRKAKKVFCDSQNITTQNSSTHKKNWTHHLNSACYMLVHVFTNEKSLVVNVNPELHLIQFFFSLGRSLASTINSSSKNIKQNSEHKKRERKKSRANKSSNGEGKNCAIKRKIQLRTTATG